MSTDTYYSTNTVLNLRFEGANGSTSIVDDKAHQIDIVGSIQIDTSFSAFGSSCANFAGNSYLNVNSVDLNIGTDSFTIEFWVRFDTVGGYLFNSRTAGIGSDGFNLRHDLYTTTAGNAFVGGGFQFQPNVWYHIAIVRDGTAVKIFVNGNQERSGTLSNNLSSTNFKIGGSPDGNVGFLDGRIDDFRFTRGVARYTSSFTPEAILTPIQIGGNITFPGNKIAVGAKVRIYNASNGSLVTEAITNGLGKYTAYVGPGEYYITTHINGWANIITNKNLMVTA